MYDTMTVVQCRLFGAELLSIYTHLFSQRNVWIIEFTVVLPTFGCTLRPASAIVRPWLTTWSTIVALISSGIHLCTWPLLSLPLFCPRPLPLLFPLFCPRPLPLLFPLFCPLPLPLPLLFPLFCPLPLPPPSPFPKATEKNCNYTRNGLNYSNLCPKIIIIQFFL